MKDLSLLREIEAKSGQPVSTCYQCCRCTLGCPVADRMDVLPHRIIRYIILGDRDKTLGCQAIWTCLQCSTCSVRCPNNIDVARVFQTLRQACGDSVPAGRDVRSFHRSFLESVRASGKMNELSVILRYKARKGSLLEDARMGMTMAVRGRVGLWPHGTRKKSEVEEIFSKAETEDP